MLYGGLRPRRRSGRRRDDHHRVLLDWHEPRVLYLSLGIVLMSCADALFTLNILAAGGEELNALMRWLISSDVQWFLGAKIGMTAAGVVLLAMAVNRRLLGRIRVLRLLQLFCVGYAALIGWELYLLAGLFPGLVSSTLTTIGIA